MTDNHDDTRTQRLNIRALRISLESALRSLPDDDARAPARERAILLLDEARMHATDPTVLAEIDALRAEWDAGSTSRKQDDAAR